MTRQGALVKRTRKKNETCWTKGGGVRSNLRTYVSYAPEVTSQVLFLSLSSWSLSLSDGTPPARKGQCLNIYRDILLIGTCDIPIKLFNEVQWLFKREFALGFKSDFQAHGRSRDILFGCTTQCTELSPSSPMFPIAILQIHEAVVESLPVCLKVYLILFLTGWCWPVTWCTTGVWRHRSRVWRHADHAW